MKSIGAQGSSPRGTFASRNLVGNHGARNSPGNLAP